MDFADWCASPQRRQQGIVLADCFEKYTRTGRRWFPVRFAPAPTAAGRFIDEMRKLAKPVMFVRSDAVKKQEARLIDVMRAELLSRTPGAGVGSLSESAYLPADPYARDLDIDDEE
jgi:hypothetical protein